MIIITDPETAALRKEVQALKAEVAFLSKYARQLQAQISFTYSQLAAAFAAIDNEDSPDSTMVFNEEFFNRLIEDDEFFKVLRVGTPS